MSTARTTLRFRGYWFVVATAAFAMILGGIVSPASASRVHVTSSPAVDVRVWVDDTWDVYPSFDDVVISLRAARGCYASVFVVDTNGFVHVIQPYSPYDDAWIEGGVTYRYTGNDLGLGRLGGQGIAYVFAVGSPHPFDYTAYGDDVFFGRFGFRIYGDPFVAFRELYVSLFPRGCDWGLVGVSYARFYVRRWVRYPSYLCLGHDGVTVHVHVGDYCPRCYRVYNHYREHAIDPYRVIRPSTEYKPAYAERTRIQRTPKVYKDGRERTATKTVDRGDRTTRVKSSRGSKIVAAKRSEPKVINKSKNVQKREYVSTRTTTKKASGAKQVTRQRSVTVKHGKPTTKAVKTGRSGAQKKSTTKSGRVTR